MSRLLVSVSCLFLLFLAFTNLSKVFTGNPALDETARIEGVYGNWRVASGAALYDRAEYLFQLGYGYARGDLLVSGATEGRDEVASPTVVAQRSEKAIELLTESLTLAPGHAPAWNTLAWAYATAGDFDNALEALRSTWKLSPNSLAFSLSRLPLVDLLLEFGQKPVPLNENDERGITADLAVVAIFQPQAHQSATANSSFLKEIAARTGQPD
jgi:tetratricopeptide (TPR) repeat protein